MFYAVVQGMTMRGGDPDAERARRINQLLDQRHARTKGFAVRVENARDVISRVLSSLERPYVAFSGGKDSTVLLHLVLEQRPQIPVLYVDQGMEYPDTYEYVKKIWHDWDLNLTWEHPDRDLWAMYDLGGFLDPDRPTDPVAAAEFSDSVFYGPIKKYSDRMNSDGFFMGLRADESHNRKLNFRRRGFIYKKADGLVAVQPIADWSTKDVWAYITSNELPYNPIYDKTKFQERNMIRVAPFGLGGWHVSLGSYVFMKYYYPELWNKFVSRYPLVRKYV